MDVTALFDDADTAEHALVSLQSLGIFPSRYKIRALHIPGETGRGKALAGAGTNNTGYTNFTADGFLYGISAGDNRETPSREVQLLLTVEASAAQKARSALISCHGRRVRVI
jgi:hypothetical protein